MAKNIGDRLGVPPDGDLARRLRPRLTALPGRTPSLNVLSDVLRGHRPLLWMHAFQIGLLIEDFPDWLIDNMNVPISRRRQVQTLMKGIAARPDMGQATNPKNWLQKDLSSRGVTVSVMTIDNWLNGVAAVRPAYREAVAEALSIPQESLEVAAYRRRKSLSGADDIWTAPDEILHSPQITQLASFAGDPLRPGFLFRIQKAMAAAPGGMPGKDDITSALERPREASWPVLVAFAYVLNEVPSWLIPANAPFGKIACKLISSLAQADHAPRDVPLPTWLTSEFTRLDRKSPGKHVQRWMSGRSKPRRSTILTLEEILCLEPGTISTLAYGGGSEKMDIASIPDGAPAAESAVAVAPDEPLPLCHLGRRILFALEYQVDGSQAAPAIRELTQIMGKGSGFEWPSAVIQTWVTGVGDTPSELETDLLAAVLSVPTNWLHGRSRKRPSVNRNADRQELAAKLRTQVNSGLTIWNDHLKTIASTTFGHRLAVALHVRGVIDTDTPEFDEILRAARYLMNMRFSLVADDQGEIIPPHREDIQKLASRCGVEFCWLSDNVPSEHSLLKYMLKPL